MEACSVNIADNSGEFKKPNTTVLAWDRARTRRAAAACRRAWSPQKEGRASQTACDHSSNSALEDQIILLWTLPVDH